VLHRSALKFAGLESIHFVSASLIRPRNRRVAEMGVLGVFSVFGVFIRIVDAIVRLYSLTVILEF